MAYLGFVPREHSSGIRERHRSITKAGNAHCRHVLVQAAWAYRLHTRVGPALAVRHGGQPAAVTLHAWKAQHRLYTMYHRLSLRRGPQIAVVAVARELIGYLWAVMRDVTTPSATAEVRDGITA
jgi:transposase